MGAFTLTARTFPGELAELERILGDMGVDAPEGIAKVRGMHGRAMQNVVMAQKTALPAIGIEIHHAKKFGDGSVRAGCENRARGVTTNLLPDCRRREEHPRVSQASRAQYLIHQSSESSRHISW
jgi:hypothetical protein